jgi:hypothetical protein
MVSVGRMSVRFVRTSTVIPSMPKAHITYRLSEAERVLVRLSSTPSAGASAGSRNIPSATESGESFTHGITDPQAAVAVPLHLGRIGLGEHGIRHEHVIPEHGVVVPWRHGSMLLGAAR